MRKSHAVMPLVWSNRKSKGPSAFQRHCCALELPSRNPLPASGRNPRPASSNCGEEIPRSKRTSARSRLDRVFPIPLPLGSGCVTAIRPAQQKHEPRGASTQPLPEHDTDSSAWPREELAFMELKGAWWMIKRESAFEHFWLCRRARASWAFGHCWHLPSSVLCLRRWPPGRLYACISATLLFITWARIAGSMSNAWREPDGDIAANIARV